MITLEYTKEEEEALEAAVTRLEEAVIVMWGFFGKDVADEIGGDTYVDRINAAAKLVESGNG